MFKKTTSFLSFDIINDNLFFLEQLKKWKSNIKHAAAFVGSIRQSIPGEEFNQSYFGGSCFSDMKVICEYLEITLNKLLMADIYGNKPDGWSYDMSFAPKNNEQDIQWIGDRSKISILYAQMHCIANLNPDKTISLISLMIH